MAGRNAIAVHLANGTVHTLFLSKNPVITFGKADPESGEVSVSFITDNEALEFKRSEVSFYNFVDAEDGLPEQCVDLTPGVKNDGTTVTVSGLADGCPVTVVNIQGLTLNRTIAGADGTANISLSELPAGVYIINYGNGAVKVTRK